MAKRERRTDNREDEINKAGNIRKLEAAAARAGAASLEKTIEKND